MENSYKSYHGVMMEEMAAEMEAKLEARVAAKAEKRRNLEIARNLLDVLDNPVIALKTGLPLSVIEELRPTT